MNMLSNVIIVFVAIIISACSTEQLKQFQSSLQPKSEINLSESKEGQAPKS